MADLVKMPDQSRWRRVGGDMPDVKHSMCRETQATVQDVTALLPWVILPASKDRRQVRRDAQSSAEPARAPDLAKFLSAFGILKGRELFGDDAVAFQRAMRDEWR